MSSLGVGGDDVAYAIYRSCLAGVVPHGLIADLPALGLDLNARVFGASARRAPLMHALARLPRLPPAHVFAALRAAGADPERPDADGETPLSLAVMHAVPPLGRRRVVVRTHQQQQRQHTSDVDAAVRRIADALGARLDAPATRRAHMRLRIWMPSSALDDETPPLQHHCALLPPIPAVHLLAADRHLFSLARMRRLLDDPRGEFGPRHQQDPRERDAQGRTLLDLPTTSPALAELLRDALAPPSPDETLALAMGLHPRLGADSPLRLVAGAVELLRDLVLPLAERRVRIADARRARLAAFEADEAYHHDNVEIDDQLRLRYVEFGEPFDPVAFRIARFLERPPPAAARALMATGALASLWEQRAFLAAHAAHAFADGPYSPALVARAEAAVLAACAENAPLL